MRGRVDVSALPAWIESWGHASDDVHARPTFESSGVTTPAVNIIETHEDLRLEMVAPGMRRTDFKVTVEDNVLTISYDHEDNRGGGSTGWKYKMREFNYHSFLRSFQLPDTLETDRIEASYTEGILNVRIPKKAEAITRRIHVE